MREYLEKGIVGTVSALGAAGLQFLQDIDVWIRVVGGMLGLVIAVFTLASMIRKWRYEARVYKLQVQALQKELGI